VVSLSSKSSPLAGSSAGGSEAGGSSTELLASILDISQLRFQDRDRLVDAFKSYRRCVGLLGCVLHQEMRKARRHAQRSPQCAHAVGKRCDGDRAPPESKACPEAEGQSLITHPQARAGCPRPPPSCMLLVAFPLQGRRLRHGQGVGPPLPEVVRRPLRLPAQHGGSCRHALAGGVGLAGCVLAGCPGCAGCK